jgi:ketosteroid isomerase-like protein
MTQGKRCAIAASYAISARIVEIRDYADTLLIASMFG